MVVAVINNPDGGVKSCPNEYVAVCAKPGFKRSMLHMNSFINNHFLKCPFYPSGVFVSSGVYRAS